MKILLVYPLCPDSFWSFKKVLNVVSKQSMLPPLGLLTVAAMLPREWEKKLVDMNVTELADEDILWADYVFVSAMQVQKHSVKSVIGRCAALKRKVVAGGPLFTMNRADREGVDHVILGEAEVTLQPFLDDLARGCAGPVYESPEKPDLSDTPVPLWELINMENYITMNIQYSRGCPHNCEFCDIIALFGKRPRTKGAEQMVTELEALYQYGWRGQIFIADDNFICNKRQMKIEVLPAMIEWAKQRNHPFNYITELTITLADDEELMALMTEAGFTIVFIGIETPSEEGLIECNKVANTGRDLMAMVKKIMNHGLEVYGGFVIGFDSDDATIFERQIDFIQKSGIIVAMVSLLMALPGTRLYERLERENRLIGESHGDNLDFTLNFVPKMDYLTLVDGYRNVLDTIYSPKRYYERMQAFYQEYRLPEAQGSQSTRVYYTSLVKLLWILGFAEKGRSYFWRLLMVTIFKRPRLFALCLRRSLYRLHLARMTRRFGAAVAAYKETAPMA